MNFDFADWRHPPVNNVDILGDPHLGRSFLHGVPLHRRGEREELVFQHFEWSLAQRSAPVHVCMGDLFHRAVVAPGVVLRAARAYVRAAQRGGLWVVLAGNHDLARDLEQVSSFDLFAEIVTAAASNIVVVRDRPHVVDDLLFVPWSPTVSAKEMVAPFQGQPFSTAFGHWDVVNPSSDTNLVPEMPNVGCMVTGHDHLRRRVSERLLVTGSMQPYAHGEDWRGTMYQTVTPDEVPSDPHYQCLRIVAPAMPQELENLDALQISLLPPRAEESAVVELSLDGFDMRTAWEETFSEFGVSAALRDQLFEQWSAV